MTFVSYLVAFMFCSDCAIVIGNTLLRNSARHEGKMTYLLRFLGGYFRFSLNLECLDWIFQAGFVFLFLRRQLVFRRFFSSLIFVNFPHFVCSKINSKHADDSHPIDRTGRNIKTSRGLHFSWQIDSFEQRFACYPCPQSKQPSPFNLVRAMPK